MAEKSAANLARRDPGLAGARARAACSTASASAWWASAPPSCWPPASARWSGSRRPPRQRSGQIHGIGPQIAQAVAALLRRAAQPGHDRAPGRRRRRDDRAGRGRRAAAARRQDPRAHRLAAQHDPRPGEGPGTAPGGPGQRARSRRRPTTSWWARTRGRKADDARRLKVTTLDEAAVPRAGRAARERRAPVCARGGVPARRGRRSPAARPTCPCPPHARGGAGPPPSSPDVEVRRQAAAWLGEIGHDGRRARAARRPARCRRGRARASPSTRCGRCGAARATPRSTPSSSRASSRCSRGTRAAPSTRSARSSSRKPDFAEGWNKRATIYFLVGDYELSLTDCDEVMARNPRHFGVAGRLRADLPRPRPARAGARLLRAGARR